MSPARLADVSALGSWPTSLGWRWARCRQNGGLVTMAVTVCR